MRRSALVVGLILLLELILVAGSFVVAPEIASTSVVPIDQTHRQHARARPGALHALHLPFQLAGGVLLVAMIGAIVLTLRHKPGVKRQDAMTQTARERQEGDGNRPASNQGRGSRCSQTGIGLGHYLTVGAILFTLGVFGIFLNRKNIIIILMSVELILLAVNINFVGLLGAAR